MTADNEALLKDVEKWQRECAFAKNGPTQVLVRRLVAALRQSMKDADGLRFRLDATPVRFDGTHNAR